MPYIGKFCLYKKFVGRSTTNHKNLTLFFLRWMIGQVRLKKMLWWQPTTKITLNENIAHDFHTNTSQYTVPWYVCICVACRVGLYFHELSREKQYILFSSILRKQRISESAKGAACYQNRIWHIRQSSILGFKIICKHSSNCHIGHVLKGRVGLIDIRG